MCNMSWLIKVIPILLQHRSFIYGCYICCYCFGYDGNIIILQTKISTINSLNHDTLNTTIKRKHFSSRLPSDYEASASDLYWKNLWW